MDANKPENEDGNILPRLEPTEQDIRMNETKEAEKFWIDRKESFVRLKLWEENRIQQTQIIATVVTGMLSLLLQRIENSAIENETFFLYFESYVKIWVDHAATIEKNAQKHFTPLRLEHEKSESPFAKFIGSVENLDLVYAQNQKAFAKMVQQLVNQNLTKVTNNLRHLVNSVHKDYERLVNSYKNHAQITEILFDQYRTHFEEREWSDKGFYGHTEDDSFILEQRYLMNTRQLMSDLMQLRELLLKLWSQAQALDQQRLAGIFDLYQEIVKSNQQIYGIQALQQMVELRSQFSQNDLFSFRGIVREKELEGFVTLCYQLNLKLDYSQVTIDDVSKVLRSVKLQAAPASNLVTRVGVLKRDPGMLRYWTDSTVVVTKDRFMHVYPFKDMMAPQKLLSDNTGQNNSEKTQTMDAAIGQSSSDKKKAGGKIDLDWSKPYTSINLNNVKSIEQRKDNKIEIVQGRPQKSRVSSQRSSSISSNLSKEARASLTEMTSASSVKFMEKVTLKGTDDNTFHEWFEYLTKPHSDEKKHGDFQIV